MFYLLHSPGVGSPLLTYNNGHSFLPPPPPSVYAPDSAAGAVANVQVNSGLKRQLQFEGCFLDPEKYDPVKRLGHGGYAKVHLCFFMEYFVHKF